MISKEKDLKYAEDLALARSKCCIATMMLMARCGLEETVSEICRRTHVQQCHLCEDTDCCDNESENNIQFVWICEDCNNEWQGTGYDASCPRCKGRTVKVVQK